MGLANNGRYPVNSCVAAFHGEYVDTGEMITDHFGPRTRLELRRMVLKGWELPPNPGDEGSEEHTSLPSAQGSA